MKKLFYVLLASVIFCPRIFGNGVAIIDAVKAKYLQLDSTTVTVSVIGQIAKTTTTQYFRNTGTAPAVTKFGFPLSEQASAIQLRWKAGTVWATAAIAGAKQDTTLPGGGGTPAASLVSYLGKTPLYFPIPDTIRTGAALAVELTYVEFLPYASGNVSYVYPSDYHLIQSGAIMRQRFDFALSSQRAIDSIRVVSTHPVALQANDRENARVLIDLQQQPGSQNYAIKYVLNSNQLGLFAFSTKFPAGAVPDSLGNGFLTFIAEPDADTTTGSIPKVFTLIVDRSGSMSGTKMDQAKKAAAFIVQNLNQGDRFNVIDFDDITASFRPGHVAFTPQARDSALLYINALYARGGTSISGAFSTAIPQFGAAADNSANIVIFLTDGQATSGITLTPTLVKSIDDLITASKRSISVFSFGIGGDVNQQLLTLIASHNKGLATFLGNDELYASITDFYLTIRYPVLINSHITFVPPVITQVYPDSLPNLYKGKQMIVAGRYQQAQPVRVVLTGTAFDRQVSYEYNVALSDTAVSTYQFLPKIWAKRKIESLMVRYFALASTSNEAKALKAEIIQLSQAYGVITAFTSYTSDGATEVRSASSEDAGVLNAGSFELLGNYPNPFNPTTTIKVRVSTAFHGVLEMRIYSILGRLVRTLGLRVSGEGIYEVVWDGRDDQGVSVPSGIYLYGMELNDAVRVGKMTLVK
ncbi:MAG: VWA domain-containing protein [Acidobacteriota bacterium]